MHLGSDVNGLSADQATYPMQSSNAVRSIKAYVSEAIENEKPCMRVEKATDLECPAKLSIRRRSMTSRVACSSMTQIDEDDPLPVD